MSGRGRNNARGKKAPPNKSFNDQKQISTRSSMVAKKVANVNKECDSDSDTSEITFNKLKKRRVTQKRKLVIDSQENHKANGKRCSKCQNNNATVFTVEKHSDGVDVEVEVDEELDYDDFEQDSMIEDGTESDASIEQDENHSEIDLDATGQTINQEKELLANPALRKLFNQLLDERIKQATEKGESSGSTLLSTMSPTSNAKGGKFKEGLVKSPSDTTIYAPAFAKRYEISKETDSDNTREKLISQIGDFVDNVRAEHEEETRKHASEIRVPGQEEARQKVDKTILEAEKFKAAIASPPGNFQQVNVLDQDGNELPEDFELQLDLNNRQNLVNPVIIEGVGANNASGISDDGFFHLICHVNQNLKEKIEKGDFIDLDKLLPRERGSWLQSDNSINEGEKLEWVRNENGTFLMPAKNKAKLTHLGNGNKLLGFMQQFIVARTLPEQEKFGSTYLLLTQQQPPSSGTMCITMTLFLDNSCSLTQAEVGP